MKKCNFCTESDHNGKCYWSTQSCRKVYCEKAINKMIIALQFHKKTKKGN